MLEARTGRPVGGQPAGSFTQHTEEFVINDDDMDSDTVRPLVKIKIILAQGERSSAKDVGPFSRRFNARQQQTFLIW